MTWWIWNDPRRFVARDDRSALGSGADRGVLRHGRGLRRSRASSSTCSRSRTSTTSGSRSAPGIDRPCATTTISPLCRPRGRHHAQGTHRRDRHRHRANRKKFRGTLERPRKRRRLADRLERCARAQARRRVSKKAAAAGAGAGLHARRDPGARLAPVVNFKPRSQAGRHRIEPYSSRIRKGRRVK